jgi:large subunit ribosomal protein L5
MAKETKQPKPAKQAKEKKQKGGAEAKAAGGVQEKGVPPRLIDRYRKEVVPALMKKFEYKSVMQVPRLHKICLNMGVGQATQDAKLLDAAVQELEAISGQKVVVTKAKKAISNFKLRDGVAIGCRATLRSEKMYEFFDRLVAIALPRVRDFRGVSDKSFDGHGNFTMGIKEQIVFPEIDVDKVSRITGLDVTFVTTAESDLESYELLKELGMPFVRREDVVQENAA